jgi:hypothetical protein
MGLPNKGGRNPTLTKPMVAALVEHLLEKPELYLDEMAWFFWDEFGVIVSTSTISRALHRAGWSKKQAKKVAAARNEDLRIYYSKSEPSMLIKWSSWMNRALIGVLVSGGQHGRLLGSLQFSTKLLAAASAGKYCQLTLLMVSYLMIYTKEQRT